MSILWKNKDKRVFHTFICYSQIKKFINNKDVTKYLICKNKTMLKKKNLKDFGIASHDFLLW